jgi:hypothetical protein
MQGLEGVKVLELGHLVSAAYAAKLMADLGADVIEKESHPVYSRRVLHTKRTFLMVYRHPDFNPWNNEVWIPQVAAQAAIDYQRKRASIFQTHKAVYNQPLDEKLFKTAARMRHGK